ncbi:hypothetical protein SteCoe_5731 [Stentor coeruleus]|uniref:Uncharacterized protein n=1 Tax=Stentor coeruleus TaxID=5963 RepID=A0A1R2CRT2_9CILI|nr:hypothetical protein SteCoe_5731 [Stentor coeruleus]
MHKRRASDDISSGNLSINRKKLSAQFMERLKSINDNSSPLSSTVKIDRSIINLHPVHNESSITNIIQEKVANLKHKFGELDIMRKKLIESRCDIRDDTDSRKSSFGISRGRSSENNLDDFLERDYIKTRPTIDNCFTKTGTILEKYEIQEKYDKDLYNERKSTQRAILERNLLERESQEKVKILSCQVNTLNLEVESLNLKLLNIQKDFKDTEIIKKQQESLLVSQSSEIKKLESRLESANLTVSHLTKKVATLEKKLRNVSQSSSTAAIKNLSYIILSKDPQGRTETSPFQVINRYLETLQELQDSDKFALKILSKIERNKKKQAYSNLLKAKTDILERIDRTAWTIEELEKCVFECRSPSPVNRSSSPLSKSSIQNEGYKKDHDDLEKADMLAWMKCQATMVEDLIMVSEFGISLDVKKFQED